MTDLIPHGVGLLPDWWLDITPHDIVDNDEEEERRRREAARLAAMKAQLGGSRGDASDGSLMAETGTGPSSLPGFQVCDGINDAHFVGPGNKVWNITKEGYFYESTNPRVRFTAAQMADSGHIPPGMDAEFKPGWHDALVLSSAEAAVLYARDDGTQWEKPAWVAQTKLRSTNRGTAIRHGVDGAEKLVRSSSRQQQQQQTTKTPDPPKASPAPVPAPPAPKTPAPAPAPAPAPVKNNKFSFPPPAKRGPTSLQSVAPAPAPQPRGALNTHVAAKNPAPAPSPPKTTTTTGVVAGRPWPPPPKPVAEEYNNSHTEVEYIDETETEEEIIEEEIIEDDDDDEPTVMANENTVQTMTLEKAELVNKGDKVGLVAKLMALPDDASRANMLRVNIGAVPENGNLVRVTPYELLVGIGFHAKLMKNDATKQQGKQMETLRQCAIISRLVIMKLYGSGSKELKQFENGLRAAFS